MPIDTKRLREEAEAARTVGPWPYHVHPQTVLELLDWIDHLEARSEQLDVIRDQVVAENESLREQLTAANAELERIRNHVLNTFTKYREQIISLTEARDEACRLLEGTINDLAQYEDDPSMLDGHRERLAACRRVGGDR